MKLIVLSTLGAIVSPAFASVVAPRQNSGKGKLPPVTVKGNAFFAGDERFYVRGVAYQPGAFCRRCYREQYINMPQVVLPTPRTLCSTSRV